MKIIFALIIFLFVILIYFFTKKRATKGPKIAKIKFIEGLLTGNDYFINIRFQVLKPGYIVTGLEQIFVIDEVKKARLEVARLPKMGNTVTKKALKKSYGYLMVFNQNKIIKRGSTIKVVVGSKTYSNIYIN